MKKTLVLALLTAMFPPATAQSSSNDGNSWHSMCSGKTEGEQAFCAGFIMGVVGGQRVQAGYTKSEPIFCVPSGVTGVQLRDVFAAYLSKNPAIRHLDGSTLAAVAMIHAFPCEKPPSKN